LRVVPYFCSDRGADGKLTDYETVIRSLVYKLSWLPSRSVSDIAIRFYGDWNRPGEEKPSLHHWKQLLDRILAKSPKTAIVIDGLDAFATTKDGDDFIKHMKEIVHSPRYRHVYFVFSSHKHVRVDETFGDELYEHRVQPGDTKADMSNFINNEVFAVREKQRGRSIFCT
jgi:hypothetical protein